jgi:hypothetical protein
MNLPALAVRYARIAPKRTHVALPLLIMTAFYWLSSLPGALLPDDPEHYALFYWISPSLQNALHVPAYAVLAGAWRWVLGAWLRSSRAQTIGAWAIAVAYGVFDEWHQSFVPGRYASLTDIVLNVAGVALGIWLAAWASRYVARSAKAVSADDDQAHRR